MSLQIALITIGIALIVIVYLISIWQGRGKSKSSETTSSYHADSDADEWPEDEIESEPVSYSDGSYSLQIPQRHDDLEWTESTSLKNLTDNSAELDQMLHESIQADIVAEHAQEDDPLADTPNEIWDEAHNQNNEPEPEQIAPNAVGSASAYYYLDIDGFERVSQIDYWVRLHGENDIGREAILAQFHKARSTLTKHNRLLGLKLPEKNWCDLEQESEDARFDDIIITLQLADQKGPVSEAELVQFSNLVANLARGTNRSFAFMAPLKSALQQANTIADFIRYYESVFAINVKPQQADYLDGGSINLYATQLGLERSEKNYFVHNTTIGNNRVCLYSLANMSDSGKFDFDGLSDLTTRGVIFFTKPAINQSPGAVFSEMVDTAKAFAGRIDGEAVTSNHETLSQADVDQIRSSIEQVARNMKELGIAPGSDEAIRIF